MVQGLPAEDAAHLGVYVHGRAADHLVGAVGPWGFLASEVMAAVPVQLARIRAPKAENRSDA
jgi:NAD(P)H-hydrate epimerase